MARITVEDCLKSENNRFALILLASKRAKQLLGGSKPVIDEVDNKPVVTALREIASGDVRYMTPEEEAAYEEALARAEQETHNTNGHSPSLPAGDSVSAAEPASEGDNSEDSSEQESDAGPENSDSESASADDE